jgi:hypothetical protein
MYSYGVSAARADGYPKHEGLARLHSGRMSHAYYRYGFEHPVENAWKEHNQIDWCSVL